MPSRQELDALRLRIRAIEAGEEAARLQRLLANIEDFPDEQESDLRSRLSTLTTTASREHLLDDLRNRERRLAAGLNPPRWERVRQEPVVARNDPATAPSERYTVPSGMDLPKALNAAFAPIVGAAISWVVAVVVLGVVNGQVDKHFDRYWAMRAGLTVVLVASYAFWLAGAAGGEARLWTLLVSTALVAAPLISPFDELVSIGLVFPAALVGALVLWLGNRRARRVVDRAVNLAIGAAGVGGVALLALVVAAIALPHPSSGSASPDTTQKASFCDKHECIGNFYAGRGSIVQCVDGMWSHSGGIQGACSWHGGER
jgi:hypothetical protein